MARPRVADQQRDVESLLAELARVRAEVEALRSEMEHQERLATLGTVAGLIAHEFNNILTPVLAYTQMSAAKPTDAALARKAVERAGAGSEQAAKIARAILGFVRKEGAGGGVFHVEQGGGAGCDVRAVVEDTLLCVPERAGVHVGVEVEPGLRAGMDSAALQQVLMNLVLNARNAIGGRSGNIRIRGVRAAWAGVEAGEAGSGAAMERAGVYTQICVTDTGPGIAAERVGGVLRAFERGGGRNERKDGGGVGLGLVVCARLVEAAGGWIGIRSKVGEGTRVRVVVRE